MKKEDKKVIRKIFIIMLGFVLYAFTLLFFIYVVSKTLSNINEEQFIEIGHEQGRRQVLDSINNSNNHGKTRFNNTRRKTDGFNSD